MARGIPAAASEPLFKGEYIPPPPPESGKFVLRRPNGFAPLVFGVEEAFELYSELGRLLEDRIRERES